MKHLNSKTVIGLGIAAVLAVLAALAVTGSRKPAVAPSAKASYLVPELRDHLNDVTAITVTGAANTPLLTVEKTPSGWILKTNGYPADVGKVRELLLKLADAVLLEQKTANEQRYAGLGVSDVADKDAKGILLTLGGLGRPVEVVIGNVNTRGDGTFVRMPGDKQSWLAKGTLSVAREPAQWLNKALVDLAAARVKEVVLQRPDGRSLRVFKAEGDTNFRLADVPKGREPASEFAVNNLGSILADLQFEDVRPARDAESPADGKLHRAHVLTFEGLSVDISAWKQGDKHYARLDASLDTAAAEARIQAEQAKAKAEFETKQQAAGKEAQKPVEPPPPAVSGPAKDRQQRLDALNAELGKLKQRFTGWTFILPAYRFSSLDKSIDDLLKPLEPGKPGGKSPGAKKK